MQLTPKPRKHGQEPQELHLNRVLTAPLSPIFSGQNAVDEMVLSEPQFQLPEELHQRVVILIDGSNLFYAASILGIEIDYAKLLYHLAQNRRLIRAYFYTGVDRSNTKQQAFLLWMRRNGYRVVTKDLTQLPDGSKKANLDVEIAVDMMTLAKYCDTIVLLSGDGDLAYAVNAVAYQGTRVEILSLRSMTNDALFNIADRYTDLESIKQNIQR